MHELADLRSRSSALSCGAEQVLQTGRDSIVYARYGNSGCTTPPSGTDPRPVLVLLQRGPSADLKIDLKATAVAACHPGKPSLGEANVSLHDGVLTVKPTTSFVVLPCQ